MVVVYVNYQREAVSSPTFMTIAVEVAVVELHQVYVIV